MRSWVDSPVFNKYRTAVQHMKNGIAITAQKIIVGFLLINPWIVVMFSNEDQITMMHTTSIVMLTFRFWGKLDKTIGNIKLNSGITFIFALLSDYYIITLGECNVWGVEHLYKRNRLTLRELVYSGILEATIFLMVAFSFSMYWYYIFFNLHNKQFLGKSFWKINET